MIAAQAWVFCGRTGADDDLSLVEVADAAADGRLGRDLWSTITG